MDIRNRVIREQIGDNLLGSREQICDVVIANKALGEHVGVEIIRDERVSGKVVGDCKICQVEVRQKEVREEGIADVHVIQNVSREVVRYVRVVVDYVGIKQEIIAGGVYQKQICDECVRYDFCSDKKVVCYKLKEISANLPSACLAAGFAAVKHCETIALLTLSSKNVIFIVNVR